MELATLDDAALLEHARQQDVSALEVLLERHAPGAFVVAYSLLGNREDAHDATQEALVRLALEVRRGDARTDFKACVYTAAYRAAIDQRRQSASRKQREREAAQASAQEAAAVSETTEQQETLAILREELAQLPEAAAVALALFYLQEMSVAETARQLGTTEAACKMRLSRGREELAQRLRRRGVSLASVVLIGGLLETLFHQSRACACDAEPGTWAYAARAAAVAKPGAEGARPPQSDADTVTGRPGRRSTAARSSLVLAAAALALLTLLIGVVQIAQQRSRTSSSGAAKVATRETAEPDAPAQPADLHASAASNSTLQAREPAGTDRDTPAPAARVVALDWQPPRVTADELTPRSSDTCGRYGVILAADYLVRKDVCRDLAILTTDDFGATWRQSKALHGYDDGAITVDAQGNCCVVAVPILDTEAIGAAEPHRRLDVFTKSPTGNFEKHQTVFSSAERGFTGSPSLVLAQSALWACTCDYEGNVHVATGESPERLREVPCRKPLTDTKRRWGFQSHALYPTWNGGRSQVCLWARDATHAGIIVPEEFGKKVLLMRTRDAGTAWTTTEIPFQALASSETTELHATPIKVVRSGERLTLLLRVVNYNAAAKTHAETSRICVMTSSNLGETWDAPHYLGEPELVADTHLQEGNYDLCVVNNRMLVSQDSIFEGTPEARALLARYEAGEPLNIGLLPSCGWTTHATLYQSEDGGVTWERTTACDVSPACGNPIFLTSDGQTAHACWIANWGKPENYTLAIRTLSSQSLPAAKLPEGFPNSPAAANKPAKSTDF